MHVWGITATAMPAFLDLVQTLAEAHLVSVDRSRGASITVRLRGKPCLPLAARCGDPGEKAGSGREAAEASAGGCGVEDQVGRADSPVSWAPGDQVRQHAARVFQRVGAPRGTYWVQDRATRPTRIHESGYTAPYAVTRHV